MSAHSSNINKALLRNLSSLGSTPAYMQKEDDAYVTHSYDELRNTALKVAAGILEEGLNFRDSVATISNTRSHWMFADLGSMLAGAITSAVYPTTMHEETAFIISDLQAKYLFLENQEQVDKITAIKERIPQVRKAFVFDGFKSEDPFFISLDELLNVGQKTLEKHKATIEKVADKITPEDILTIIYTSGTTGNPKGVVLTHKNYMVTFENLLKHSPKLFGSVERNLSFLPLAHALEKTGGYLLMLHQGKCIGYAQGFDTLIDDFAGVKPDVIAAVPRVFEKMYSRIQEGLKNAPKTKVKLFDWALKVGEQSAPYRKERKPMPFFLGLQFSLASRLIYQKVKDRFGGRVKFFISGGAPLSKTIAEFFYALDLPIFEGWGATEGTAPYTVNVPEAFQFGTVGKAIPCIDIRCAADGELEVKGPNMFGGYYNKPDVNKESFTEDGYFKTGDIGEIDKNGWVKITGRKKQLLITAGGKNVAPAIIQKLLMTGGIIESAHIHGDKRKYITALISIDPLVVEGICEKLVLEYDYEKCTCHPHFEELVQQEIDKANTQLAKFMQIKYFRILEKNLTVDGGELTPTLKIKTRVVESRYQDLLNSMYEEVAEPTI